MILHTIVPADLIFQSSEIEETSEQLFLYQGIPVACQPLNSQEWQVTKIMSTNPEHFLHDQIFPGAIMRFW